MVQIKEVLRSTRSWDGAPLPAFGSGTTEMRVLHFKLGPGAKTTIHMHPLNGAGYMIAGTLTMYAADAQHWSFNDHKRVKTVVLNPGEAWDAAVKTRHYGINEGKEEVEFFLIFAGHEKTPPTLSLGTRLD